ncbi:hypothetical protein DUNSADRAFT_1827 [Dunaliella salina]|uniref:Uncharacterized protein n=1 Tax=Dunaliella salina TaxID=3046 RepID=A0ABQ7FWY7_DUNSA|nr:hypothetical protein DUNSADRAFT_1827 [Dunaliella salina]|eukprot:KAF5826881.1 hypothetical protein DUNSADRAFT_1827 [Dunaliella salina]
MYGTNTSLDPLLKNLQQGRFGPVLFVVAGNQELVKSGRAQYIANRFGYLDYPQKNVSCASGFSGMKATQVNRGSIFSLDEVWILYGVSLYCDGNWTEYVRVDPFNDHAAAPNPIEASTTSAYPICPQNEYAGVKTLEFLYGTEYIGGGISRDTLHIFYPLIRMECLVVIDVETLQGPTGERLIQIKLSKPRNLKLFNQELAPKVGMSGLIDQTMALSAVKAWSTGLPSKACKTTVKQNSLYSRVTDFFNFFIIVIGFVIIHTLAWKNTIYRTNRIVPGELSQYSVRSDALCESESQNDPPGCTTASCPGDFQVITGIQYAEIAAGNALVTSIE